MVSGEASDGMAGQERGQARRGGVRDLGGGGQPPSRARRGGELVESWAELAAGEARKKRSEATEAARLLGKRGEALCPPGSAAPDGGELDDASQAFVRRRAEVEQVRARLLGRLGVLAGLVGDDARGLLGRVQLSQLAAAMDAWLGSLEAEISAAEDALGDSSGAGGHGTDDEEGAGGWVDVCIAYNRAEPVDRVWWRPTHHADGLMWGVMRVHCATLLPRLPSLASHVPPTLATAPQQTLGSEAFEWMYSSPGLCAFGAISISEVAAPEPRRVGLAGASGAGSTQPPPTPRLSRRCEQTIGRRGAMLAAYRPMRARRREHMPRERRQLRVGMWALFTGTRLQPVVSEGAAGRGRRRVLGWAQGGCRVGQSISDPSFRRERPHLGLESRILDATLNWRR